MLHLATVIDRPQSNQPRPDCSTCTLMALCEIGDVPCGVETLYQLSVLAEETQRITAPVLPRSSLFVETFDLQGREWTGEVLAIDGDHGFYVAGAIRQSLRAVGEALAPAVETRAQRRVSGPLRDLRPYFLTCLSPEPASLAGRQQRPWPAKVGVGRTRPRDYARYRPEVW
jgi:hypothetical protein